MSGNEQLERDLDSFLSEDDSHVAAIYRKLPQPEPSTQLDAAVRAIAHRAVRASSRPVQPRWFPGLGIAAAVMLAAGVVIRLGPQIWNARPINSATPRDQPSQMIAHDSRSTAAPLEQAATATPPAVSAPLAPIPAPVPKMPPPPVQVPSAKLLRVQPSPQPPAPPTSVQSGSPATVPEISVEPRKNERRQIQTTDQRTGSASAQAFPAATSRLRDEIQSKAQASAANEFKQKRNADAALPAPRSPVATAAPPPPEPAPAAGMAAPQSNAAQSSARAKANLPYSAQLRKNSHLYPESWIAAIRRLIGSGRDVEADANLDYFRKKYPDYPLPADIEKFDQRTQ